MGIAGGIGRLRMHHIHEVIPAARHSEIPSYCALGVLWAGESCASQESPAILVIEWRQLHPQGTVAVTVDTNDRQRMGHVADLDNLSIERREPLVFAAPFRGSRRGR